MLLQMGKALESRVPFGTSAPAFCVRTIPAIPGFNQSRRMSNHFYRCMLMLSNLVALVG